MLAERIQRIPVTVSASGTAVTVQADILKGYKYCKGIKVTFSGENTTIDALQATDLSDTLRFGNEEILPKGLPLRDLMTGINVAPDCRWKAINACANDNNLTTEVTCTTGSFPGGGFTFEFQLLLTNEEPDLNPCADCYAPA